MAHDFLHESGKYITESVERMNLRDKGSSLFINGPVIYLSVIVSKSEKVSPSFLSDIRKSNLAPGKPNSR